MKRRSHQKSRHGCHECKKRHIKCDEGRPKCGNCMITKRTCDFEVRNSAHHGRVPTAPATSNPSAAASPTPPTDATALLGLRPPLDPAESPQSPADVLSGASAVNLYHMELMAHYTFAVSNPEIDPDLDTTATKMVVQTALDFPWLLHEVLAISSRHLAVVRPARAVFYRSQASQLQTQALHLFNTGCNSRLPPVIDAANSAAVVLFSSMLGRHLLTDALDQLIQDPEGSSAAALDRYCRYLQVHVGLRVVATSAWPYLKESDLYSLILMSGHIGTAESSARGTELRDLSRWVEAGCPAENHAGADEVALRACLEAIDLLQVGLDAALLPSNPPRPRRGPQLHHMVFSWSVRCPARFNELVQQRWAPTLVVLAHYAVLLHFSRGLWHIGASAPRFLRVIGDVLGSAYDAQLAWPRAIVCGGEGVALDTATTSSP